MRGPQNLPIKHLQHADENYHGRWLFSIGFLRCPFAFFCSPQNDANNRSSSCFRVSSFSFFFFFCQYTHTHTQNLLSPTPLFDWAYTCTLSPGFSCRYLVLSRNMVQVEHQQFENMACSSHRKSMIQEFQRMCT